MAANDAAQIRARYKARGWTSPQISVRNSNFSLGSSVRVLVRDPQIPFRLAERLANQEERISRCGLTGETLGGGNMYVHVQHSRECREILARRHVQAIEEALARIGEDTTRLEPVSPSALIGRPRPWTVTVWPKGNGRSPQDCCDVAGAAYTVALLDPDQQDVRP
jgi:hypothetical protein